MDQITIIYPNPVIQTKMGSQQLTVSPVYDKIALTHMHEAMKEGLQAWCR